MVQAPQFVVVLCVLCLLGQSHCQTVDSEPRLTGKLAVAASMRKVGRVQEAESMLRAWQHAHGDNLAFMEELGLTLAQQGKRKEAIEEYRKAIQRFPNAKSIAGVYSNLGLAYEFSHEPTPALEAYKKAIKADPELEAPRVNLGNFYRFVKKDFKRAAAQLENARRINPESYITHFGLAAVYADQGQLSRAEESFREAIKLTSDPTVAKTELAYVLSRRHRLEEAEELFSEVLAGHPTFYRAHEGLARVYQGQHRMKKAEKQAKLAVSLHKDEGTQEVLADIYQHEKDMPHAHKWWRAVLKANPTDRAALHYLGLDGKGDGDSSSGSSDADDEVPGVDDQAAAVPHNEFMLILFLALGGGAVVVGVVAYSVHLKSQQDTQPKKWTRVDASDEGVGLMSSADDLEL